MKSTVGRPRVLTDDAVAMILAWHEEWSRLKTRKELALELGVSQTAIWHVIERRGQYKQASPERRGAEIAERRRLIARMEKEKNRKPKREGRDCRVARG